MKRRGFLQSLAAVFVPVPAMAYPASIKKLDSHRLLYSTDQTTLAQSSDFTYTITDTGLSEAWAVKGMVGAQALYAVDKKGVLYLPDADGKLQPQS